MPILLRQCLGLRIQFFRKIGRNCAQGFLPKLLAAEKDIFNQTDEFLKKSHTPAEFSAFQRAMADKAMGVLESVKLLRPVAQISETSGPSGGVGWDD